MTHEFRAAHPALLLLLACTALGACAPQTPSTSPAPTSTTPARAPVATVRHFPSDEELEPMLRYLVEDGATPGIVLGILEAGGSTRVLSYGSGGPGTRPLGAQSVFEIGSINKTFTGALLADLVRRGEVALDDPVAKYLPDSVRVPSRGRREITLLDLATHTSGLPRLPDNHVPANLADPYADYTIEKLYAFLSNHELRRDPGAEGEYSNLGMGLLGHALARAGNTSYENLVRERILEPLGMTMTGYPLAGEMAAWTTRGHDDGDVVPYWFGTEAIFGAGGMRSTMADMLAYLRANVGEPRSDIERAMRDAHRVHRSLGENRGIGLGWQVQNVGDRELVQHGGGTGGYSTHIAFDPEQQVGVVMLTNVNEFSDDLAQDLLRRGRPLALPEVPVAPEVLSRYVGEYEAAPGRSIYVRVEDGKYLTLQTPGNVRFRMYADSDTSFFLKRTPWRVRFTRDASGEVAGMTVDMEGTERTARRVAAVAPPAGTIHDVEVPDLPLTPEQIAGYEGTYSFALEGDRTLEVRVFASDGKLMAQAAGQGTMRLLHQGKHTFIAATDQGIRLFFQMEDGRATGVTLHQRGRSIPGERVP